MQQTDTKAGQSNADDDATDEIEVWNTKDEEREENWKKRKKMSHSDTIVR